MTCSLTSGPSKSIAEITVFLLFLAPFRRANLPTGSSFIRLTEATAMASIRGSVYVIDDDVTVREGLARLLESFGFAALPFPSAASFLDSRPAAPRACILLDLNMPGMTGPEMHRVLVACGSVIPIVYLTGYGTVAAGVSAMSHGAFDFLEKPIDAQTLITVLEEAMAEHARRASEEDYRADIRGRLCLLSPRESEVMNHVIQGRLNKQIAGDLAINIKTVKVHRGRAMAKMRARSVAQLVRLCDAVKPRDQAAWRV